MQNWRSTVIGSGLAAPYLFYAVLLLILRQKISDDNYTNNPQSFSFFAEFLELSMVVVAIVGFIIATYGFFSKRNTSGFKLLLWIGVFILQCLGLFVWSFSLYTRAGGVL
jgi:hypothetical protein